MVATIQREPEIHTYESWLEMRQRAAKKGHLGASQVGAAIGVSEQETPFTLWCKMTGRLPLDEETIAMRVGKHDEPLVAQLYEEDTGATLINPGQYAVWRHPEFDWLFATPDYLEADESTSENCPVECKRSDSVQARRWVDDDMPLEYDAQLLTQGQCLGASRGVVAGLIGYKLRIRKRRFNHSTWEWLVDRADRFRWHVLNDVAPEVDGSAATSFALRLLHPSDNGQTITLPDDLADTVREWQEMTAEAKALDKMIAGAKNKIIAAIGDATFAEIDGIKLSYKNQTRAAYEVTEKTFRVLRKVGK